ncbi:unnamed protein product [Prunus armeniaca]
MFDPSKAVIHGFLKSVNKIEKSVGGRTSKTNGVWKPLTDHPPKPPQSREAQSQTTERAPYYKSTLPISKEGVFDNGKYYKSTSSAPSRAVRVPSRLARGQLGGARLCLWFIMACAFYPLHREGGTASRVTFQFRYGGGHVLLGWGLVMGDSVYCGF